MLNKLKALRRASLKLKNAPSEKRDKVLLLLADQLEKNKKQILGANQRDFKNLKRGSSAFADRLLINGSRLQLMAESLRQVAALSDPLAEKETHTLENGLVLNHVRAPLGVIFLIFEARPNVVTEAFGLAFKAGNSIILRGGRESAHTTGALYKIMGQVLRDCGFSGSEFWGITNYDRSISQSLLTQKEFIDIVVPRGSETLINFVVQHSAIPIIKNDRGMCHVYVHSDANLEMAAQIVFNAKCQRPGVCNAMETVLVHKTVAKPFLERLYLLTEQTKLVWHGDQKTVKILTGKRNIKKARSRDWDTEYLDYCMNSKIVASLEEAIQHIEDHGSRHSEAIVTESEVVARRFQNEVDAAAVFWNASTRFTDGYEFGLGGELGISTQKLHVRGPVGLKELTSFRWTIDGSGQVRK